MPSLSVALAATILLAVCCITASQNLDSLIDLAHLLASNQPKSTTGNINIIQGGGDDGSESSVALCHIPYLFLFSLEGQPANFIGSFEGLAAISLALEHLNSGDGRIVPEIEGLPARCPLRFTTQSHDTKLEKRWGVDEMIGLTDRTNTGQLLPCAILGAAASSVSIPTSIIR